MVGTSTQRSDSRMATDPAVGPRPCLAVIGLALAFATAGCVEEQPDHRQPSADQPPLTISVLPVASVRQVGSDTLSDGARILRLIPEDDGAAVAIVFADSARGIGSGLALAELDGARQATPLLWPDSVTAVWWSAPHAISFTTSTGRGVRVVVDVHAESLAAISQGGSAVPGAARLGEEPASAGSDSLRAKAQLFVDSAYAQPGGEPTKGSLRYQVTRVLPGPGATHAAFHVLANDGSGRRVNPSWYLMRPGGDAVPVDEVIGPAAVMPAGAGAWAGRDRFLYAKGVEINGVDVGSSLDSATR